MIDLHCHSTFSDGSLTPGELVRAAEEAELSALALTDHDTLSGLPDFLKSARKSPLRAIPGIELSAEFSPGTMHILGYFMDLDNKALLEAIEAVQGGRNYRNRKIWKRINELGYKLDWERIEEKAGSDVVGRPHFAQALIEAGYFKGKQEVFDKLLAKGKPGYVNRFRLTPQKCIELIRNAGGVVVLAHPVTLKLSDPKLKELVAELAGLGLQGIEVFYPEHDRSKMDKYAALAREYELVATGGTDFHGKITPHLSLGRGRGDMRIRDEIVSRLLEQQSV